ncbi:hypothetical protein JYU10_00435 [bacterium AH-315-J04]|nr:hypothetical protein [bacterium AH-315-J04]
MSKSEHQHDPLEQAIAELVEVERAGVFRPTRLDKRELLMDGQTVAGPAWLKWGKHWVALAAMAGISVVVWSVMFKMQFDKIRSGRNQSVVSHAIDGRSPNSGCSGDFLNCFNGPTKLAMTTCQTFDYDLDGDIDMLDMQTYQQNCQGLRRLP